MMSIQQKESEALMGGLSSLKFNMYKCDNLIVPSTFSSPEIFFSVADF